MSFYIDAHAPQLLGNYRVLRLLGQGEFAAVYLAEHVRLKTLVAIKVLQAALRGNEPEVFLEEARTLAFLRHPHIVRVLDFGVEKETPFLVIDYAPDGTLRQLHPAGTRLPLTPVVRYIKQIAAALQYAHEHQVIHRDVKPDNMLVSQHNQVLLSDFGIAVVSPPTEHARGGEVGSSAYAAPEQLLGRPCPASDQYALGIVAYEWLAGARPFSGAALEMLVQHQSRQPPPLQAQNPDVSAAIEAVVLRALAKDPVARWPSVTAFADALEQACKLEASYIPRIATSDEQHPYSFGRTHTSPLVGREREWEALHRLLVAVEQLPPQPETADNAAASDHGPGDPHCVLLVGELGIGKTRLAEDISREAQRRGWAVAWGRCYANAGSAAYQLWGEVLRHLLTSGAWSIQAQGGPGGAFAPALRQLLREYADPPLSGGAWPRLSPEQERWQLWEAVGALLTHIARRIPLMVVLDDLHWADESSLELLAYLLRHLQEGRVLFVGTFRHTELPQTHLLHTLESSLRYERHTERLLLHPLTKAQVRKMLPRLPAEALQEIQAASGGNPFFAEELARERGAGAPSHGVPPRPLAGQRRSPLPGAITAALERRIGQISAACQQLLSLASVLGGSFAYATLSAMMDGDPAPERGLDLLDEAVKADMLVEEGSRNAITYSFWHPLMVQYLYERLSAARRVQLHRAAATALIQFYQGREDEGAATIVAHLVECGSDPLTIARYAELAADRAARISAYPEAARQYRLAVSHWEEAYPHCPAGGETDACLHLAILLERLGECHMNQGSYEEVRRSYERVIAIRGQLRPPSTGERTSPEAQIVALLWSEIGRAWRMQGQYARAAQGCESGEAVLQQAGIATGPALANLRLQAGLIEWQLGHNERARALAREALSLFEETIRPTSAGSPPRTEPSRTERLLAGDPAQLGETHEALSNIASSEGQSAEALSHLLTALSVYEQHGLSRGIAHVTGNLGFTYLLLGEDALAQHHLDRSSELAERVGDLPVQAVATLNLGELAARSGELARAEVLFRRCLALTRQVGDRETEVWAGDSLATVCREQGKLTDAQESIAAALRLSRSIQNTQCLGLMLVALGNLRLGQALAASEEVQRRRLLLRARRSLDKALSYEHLYTEPRAAAHLALAQIAFRLGQREAAQREAGRALEEAQAGDLLLIQVRAQRLLGGLMDARAEPERVAQLFEQALQQCRLHHMRLEEGRTLQNYAEALLTRCDPAGAEGVSEYQQALKFLDEARSIFSGCHAALDFRLAEQLLAEAPNNKPFPLLF